jgi:diguanylate cyclase (GGDEF)-like protein
MLLEEGHLAMKAARGIPGEVARKIRMKVGEGIAGAVAASGKPVLVRDVAKEPRVNKDVGTERRKRYAGSSFASVPIMLEDQVIGVINVTNKRSAAEFGDEDLEFLETIAAQSAVAIENARLLRETQVLAHTDGLTGLYNHRYLQERLGDEIERFRRYRRKGVSFVMFDIDHFKRFNDTYGHRAGDEVLRGVARRLRTRARKVDICGRYGGEEFSVILPEVGKRGALAYAQRVLASLEDEPIAVRDPADRIAMSAGVATFPDDAATPAELIEAADRALYAAKSSGRNRVCCAGKDPRESAPAGASGVEGAGRAEEE